MKFLLIIALFCVKTASFAQTYLPIIDTIPPFREGVKTLMQAHDYKKGEILLEEAAKIYIKKNNINSYLHTKTLLHAYLYLIKSDAKEIKALEELYRFSKKQKVSCLVEQEELIWRLAHIYIGKDELDKAKILVEEGRGNLKNILPPYNLWAQIKFLEADGRIALYEGKTSLALNNFKQSLALLAKNRVNDDGFYSEKANIYNYIGACYEQIENFKEAASFYEKAYKQQKESKFKSILLATFSYNLSYIDESIGNYAQAIAHYQESIKIWTEFAQENSIDVGDAYAVIAGCYLEQQNIERASIFSQKALAIYKKSPYVSFQSWRILYSVLSDIARYQGHNEEAIRYAKQSVAILQKDKGNSELANAIKNLAEISLMTGDFASARQHFAEANNLYLALKNDAKSGVCQLGLLEIRLKESIKTEESPHDITAQLNRLSEIFQQNHNLINLSRTYALLSVAFSREDGSIANAAKSTEFANKAISACLSKVYTGSHLKVQDIVSLTALLDVLNLLTGHKEFEKRSFYRLESLNLIAFSNYNLLNSDAKVNTSLSSRKIINEGLADAFKNTAVKNKTAANPIIFQFIEHGKSLSILEKQQKIDAQERAALPRVYLEAENALNAHLAFLRLQLADLQERNKDLGKQQKIQAEMSSLMEKYYAALDEITKEYPDYQRFIGNNTLQEFSDFQKELADDEVFIDYFFTTNLGLISLFIGKNQSQLEITTLSESEITAEITHFQGNILNLADLSDDLSGNAKSLYKICHIDAIARLKKYKHLLISPDAALYRLPFEILQNEKNAYLLETHSICYTPSASIYTQSLQVPHEGYGNGLLAIAPNFGSNTENDLQKEYSQNSNSQNSNSQNSNPQNLPFAAKEVAEIAKICCSDSATNSRATKGFFCENAPKYRVLHLATHAILDTINPLKTRLLFTKDKKIGGDEKHNFIEITEIFSLRLRAELVSLSACNTGAGVLLQGEGVQSLAHSFAQAGVPNLIATQWQVSDKSSSKIMVSFYQYLENGLAKDEALRQAKLDFLKHADVHSAAPFYWAGAVLMGNRLPLTTHHHTTWTTYFFYLLACLLLIFGLFFRNKRKIAHQVKK
ncbi:MAG: hypothetical protein RI894_1844 [Bacteroidota bacterium]